MPTSAQTAFNRLSLVQSCEPSATATDPMRPASIALNPLPPQTSMLNEMKNFERA